MLRVGGAKRWLLTRQQRTFSSLVDQEEVQKFVSVSKDWWDPTSTSGVGLLHQLNPIRVQFIRHQAADHFRLDRHHSEPFRGLRVADIGCGGGILSESLRRLGAQMVSIDPGAENIGAARNHAARDPVTASIDYRCTTSDQLVHQQEQFDIVCSLEVIEHVPDAQAFVSSLTPLVKPGGLLFLSSVNRTFLSYLLAIGAAEHLLQLVPPGTHDWNKFLGPEDIAWMLRKDQFKVRNVSGIVGNPLCNDWRLEEHQTLVNYILCASKRADNQ